MSQDNNLSRQADTADTETRAASQRSSPLPLVAIALSAIALLATLFGPFRDYATQQRAVTDTATQVESLNSRFDNVSTRVDKFKDDLTGLTERIGANEAALQENATAVETQFSDVSATINKSLDDKLAVTRNSIDQALRSAREDAAEQFDEMQKESNEKLLALADEKSALDSSGASSASTVVLSQLNARIESLDTMVANNAQALEGLVSESMSSNDGGSANIPVTRFLDDAQTWLTLANDRLQLSGDVEFARTALGVVQNRLANTQDVSQDASQDDAVASVQAAIEADLARLENADAPDIPGIVARIRQLAAEAKSLPFASPPQLHSTGSISNADDAVDTNNAETTNTESTDNANPNAEVRADTSADTSADDDSFFGGLKSAVKNVGNEMKLGDLVTIKKSDSDYKVLLTPEHRYFLRQNMNLMLQSAQLGLLRNDSQTFYDNLATVNEWVSEYYANDEQQVMDFAHSIQELTQLDVKHNPVDISATVEALEQLSQERSSQ